MKDERTTARWRIRGWKLYRSLNRGNVARAARIQANKRRHTGAQEKARKLAHERAQVLSSCTLHPVSCRLYLRPHALSVLLPGLARGLALVLTFFLLLRCRSAMFCTRRRRVRVERHPKVIDARLGHWRPVFTGEQRFGHAKITGMARLSSSRDTAVLSRRPRHASACSNFNSSSKNR